MKYNRIKNKGLITIILLLLFSMLLSACSNGGVPNIKNTNYHTGSQGLTIDLLEKDFTNEVYEDSTFSYSMVIENKGAFDVVEENKGILTIGYDPYYIELSPTVPKNPDMTIGKGSISFKGIELIGKSKYYPSGSNMFFYFPYLKTKKIEGQRSKPDTQLFSSICYPYKTYLTELVCIDFDVYKENARTQVCKQQDLSFSNQGAPVAISLVEVENQPLNGNQIRPVYTIHFSNVGQGTVLSPVKSSDELKSVCTSEGLDKTDFNSVEIQAWLSTDVKLTCTPDKVRLNDQEGIARCTLPDDQISTAIKSGQNYQAPLTVELNYVYLSTLYKTIEIKRLNPYGTNVPVLDECFGFEVKGKDGKCQQKCEYCAENPTDSICADTGSKTEITWDVGFGCSCSKKNCDLLSPKGLCVPSANFCAPGTHCCGQLCSGSQKKFDDGKCYPVCSTCTTIKTPCLCGSDESFDLLTAGFCSSQKKAVDTLDECKKATAQTTESQ